MPARTRIERDEEPLILARYQAGESARALGRDLGIDPHAILDLAKKHGVHRGYAEAHRLHFDLNGPPLTDEILADIIVRHAAGEPLYKLAREHGWKGHQDDRSRLVRALRERGADLRSRGEASRLANQHPELAGITANRWWELYWGPDSGFPSLERLAEQFGVERATLRKYLARAGITLRDSGTQVALEFRLGRLTTGNPAGYGANVVHMIAANRERPPRPATGPRPATRRSVTRPCAWCGQPVTRIPSQMPEYPGCSASHAGRASQWRRHHVDAPRPLIVEALRARLAGERTYDRSARLGAALGATEEEILEALTPDP